MAKNKEELSPVLKLSSILSTVMEDMFGECIEEDGMFRVIFRHMGVADAEAVVDVLLEGGMNGGDPYGVLHFHTTVASDIPDEVLANVLIALNDLNHVISAGAFPGFGCFAYYEPLKQIYMSYRKPVSLLDPEKEEDNIRFYLGTLYDQMDLFMDYILFVINNDAENIGIEDYMEYLDKLSDLAGQEGEMNALEEIFNEMLADQETGSGETAGEQSEEE